MISTFTISATEARRLMKGDAVALWHEKKGLAAPADLSDELRVQLGSFTEPFNRRWFEKKVGPQIRVVHTYNLENLVTRDGHRVHHRLDPNHLTSEGQPSLLCSHPQYTWAICHPDGFVVEKPNTVLGLFEAKHTAETGDFVRPTDVVEMNYWQLVHQMMVTGLDRVFLSVLYGNSEWRVHEVLRDDNDIATLLGTELMFLKELEGDTAPGIITSIAPDRIPGVPTKKLVTADVDAANWASDYVAAAGEFAALYGSDVKLDDAKTRLRGLLPEDAERIEAYGVRVQRTKRAITVSVLKDRAA